ncbi:hypothetical protein TthTMY_09660 [Thermus thermophilus]|nr:hypothetical protein TthTMY_09660 [Thermus thermophilus]
MALAWQSPVYLERKRLLDLLPEEPGFAVHLEAPAGFGKSVLAGQLASRLGLRTFWASALLGEPRALLAEALGLPREAPWGAVVAALGEVPSLVVLEDLTGEEALSPLLRTLPCLLVLASRKLLPYPELPKLLAEGRLVHLKAPDLAFTEEEAEALFGGREGWREAHRATGGWALPLFLSAFTGRPPEPMALLQGLRESLSEEEFQEGLLLAALPLLPAEKALPVTEGLFQKGLLQRVPPGYRLHPLLREMAQRTLRAEVQEAVRKAEGRLPPELWAEALFGAGLEAELLRLLESPIPLPIPAEKLLAWEGLLRRGGPRTRLRLGRPFCRWGGGRGSPSWSPWPGRRTPPWPFRPSGTSPTTRPSPSWGRPFPRPGPIWSGASPSWIGWKESSPGASSTTPPASPTRRAGPRRRRPFWRRP